MENPEVRAEIQRIMGYCLELAYSLIFSLLGNPVLRYGDEIRMGDDLNLEGCDAVRTPMQ